MKKINVFIIILSLCMMLSLTACDRGYTINFNVVNEYGGNIMATKYDKVYSNEIVSTGGNIFDVVFTAVPYEGWKVKEWKHNGKIVNDDNLTYEITTNMSDWNSEPKYTLNITVEFERIVDFS